MNVDEQKLKEQRKAAVKTAVILAVVALGFFSWAVYIVVSHAT